MTQDLREQLIAELCTCETDVRGHLCSAPELADAVLEVLRERFNGLEDFPIDGEQAINRRYNSRVYDDARRYAYQQVRNLFSQSQSVTHAESEEKP